MSDRVAASELAELARSYGVQPSYVNASGRRVTSSAGGVLAALSALGAPIARPSDVPDALRARRIELGRRFLEPVVVAWDGRLRGVEARVPDEAKVELELEEGVTLDVERERRPDGTDGLSFGGRLPAGYHTLRIETNGARVTATVLSAPRRAPAMPAGAWAVFAPLYALRSRSDWGIGSFTELAAFDRLCGERGATMLGTLPLLAAFLDEPFEPSPYSPASRLFWNEAFVDVERVAELDRGASAPKSARPPERVRASDLVDHREVNAAKRRALEPLAEAFFAGPPAEGFEAFVRGTPSVREYARFRAEIDRRRSWWPEWPEREREGTLDGDPEADPGGRYHLYAQWLAHEQLRAVGERANAAGRGLYLDLPLGVNAASYDVWRHRRDFATGASVGAPPDQFFSGGQDWGFPPLHPDGVRETRYAYPRAVVANLLRYAKALRLDHVMGLHRLYWIPGGGEPRDGAYVRYRADEWYAVLSIEAHRAGAAIVGEDLGTVPGYVRRAMRRHRFHTSYVIQFETDSERRTLHEPSPASAASLGTHDLPTWAGFWSGDDIALYRRLGLLDEAEAAERSSERRRTREAIVAALGRRGLLAAGAVDAAAVEEAALRFLAGSDAALVVVALEDLWLETRQQNVPGTGSELENWRRRLPRSLDEIAADAGPNALLATVARDRAEAARSRGAG